MAEALNYILRSRTENMNFYATTGNNPATKRCSTSEKCALSWERKWPSVESLPEGEGQGQLVSSCSIKQLCLTKTLVWLWFPYDREHLLKITKDCQRTYSASWVVRSRKIHLLQKVRSCSWIRLMATFFVSEWNESQNKIKWSSLTSFKTLRPLWSIEPNPKSNYMAEKKNAKHSMPERSTCVEGLENWKEVVSSSASRSSTSSQYSLRTLTLQKHLNTLLTSLFGIYGLCKMTNVPIFGSHYNITPKSSILSTIVLGFRSENLIITSPVLCYWGIPGTVQ